MWKWLALIAISAWSLALVTPFKEKVKLGLDLRGGTSFTVEVDREDVRKQLAASEDFKEGKLDAAVGKKVVEARDVAIEVVRGRIDGLGIAEPEIYPMLDDRIVIRLPGVDADKRAEAKESILSVAFLEFRLVHTESDAWVNELFAAGKTPKGFRAVQADGDRFYVRDRDAVADEDMDRAFWNNMRRFGARHSAEFMLSKDSVSDGSTIYRPMYVEIRKQMDGSSLKGSHVDYDQNNRPYISLTFNPKGADRFAAVTASYAPGGDSNSSEHGRRLAIILDGKLYSAPTIQEAIFGGNAQITGSYTMYEVQQMVNVLNAGALPVPVKIVEERTVDPTLGKDAISSSIKATILGGVAVLVFMMVYYMMAGVIANVSLLLVMLLLPFGMWFSSGFLGLFSGGTGAAAGLPVLTLPGIAGIVLTIGMAVDANVLIFERMREEFAVGKGFLSAISSGYDKAFSTILDANVTTLLTAVILFWQGSGAIRGFAVTLSAGILVSMLIVLVFTRLFLTTVAEHSKIDKLKMLTLFKAGHTKFDFVGKRKLAAFISIGLIVVTWGFFVVRGQSNFGVDFTGGSALSFRFDEKQSNDAVRTVLEDAGISEAYVQYQKEIGTTGNASVKEALEVKVGYEDGAIAQDAIVSAFADQGYEMIANDTVGPQIGQELKKKGVTALVLALVGIIIYISIRFEFSFAVGAIVAVLHDVLITIGLYCLFGHQLSLTVIAALLTIVGYSVNDTIVVFDRIREDVKLMKGQASYSEIANLSINQTLSRTVLTSVTTLLTVTMLLFFGGGAIHDFALALFIGILVGTYSSIFVATPIVLFWHKETKV